MDLNLNRSIFKWLIITIIILILLLFGTNLAWIIYESQYQDIATTEETNLQTVENVENIRDITQN